MRVALADGLRFRQVKRGKQLDGVPAQFGFVAITQPLGRADGLIDQPVRRVE